MNEVQDRDKEGAPRVGLYIQPATRARLNLYKDALAVHRGQHVNQDETINYLLDSAPPLPVDSILAQQAQP